MKHEQKQSFKLVDYTTSINVSYLNTILIRGRLLFLLVLVILHIEKQMFIGSVLKT